jgi:ribosomal protein L20A (L18A)
MSQFKVVGRCTVKQGRDSYWELFAFWVKAVDESDAVYAAELLAVERAEINSEFLLNFQIRSEVEISEVREVPESELLLMLPRELAPMLPGF